jgi:ubiquinone/menaquinone biosynthesis C-methylase UbiE
MYEAPKVTKEEIIRSYNQAFAVSDHLRDSDALYRWVLQKLNPQAGTNLLDVACGLGLLIRYAEERGVHAYGIDISQQAASLARKEAQPDSIFVGDGEHLPFPDAYFDYITNLGSLEHFIDPVQGIREMQRVMKPGGVAAIYLPNSYYLIDIIFKVWRTGYGVSHRQVLERFATHNEWADFLRENGFQILKSHKYNHIFPQTAYDWKWHWKHPKRIALTLVAPFIPFHLSYHFLFICRKAGD